MSLSDDKYSLEDIFSREEKRSNSRGLYSLNSLSFLYSLLISRGGDGAKSLLLKGPLSGAPIDRRSPLPKLDLLGGESMLRGGPLLGALLGERSLGPLDDMGGPRDESLNILLGGGGEGGARLPTGGGEK